MSAPQEPLWISEETQQFLWGIRLNNERGWFLAHKDEYLRTAYEPLRQLGVEVQSRVLAANPGLELNLRVSRIYRDVRLVRDGRYYRDYLWFSLFPPHERGTPRAEFFLGVLPEELCLGVGYYWMPASLTALYRRKILEQREAAERLARSLAKRPEYSVSGEEYKRAKGAVSDPLKPWFNRKTVSFTRTLDYGDPALAGPGLADVVTADIQWLMPLYRAFEALEQAWDAEEVHPGAGDEAHHESE